MTVRRISLTLVVLLAVLGTALAGCGATPAPTAEATRPSAAPAAASSPAPTAKVAPTATSVSVPPTAQGPKVGGKFVWALPDEPDTLDVHKSGMTVMEQVMANVGATLIARDPANGKFVGYLAESWTIAPDGLTMEFKLRKGVQFHDGTPLKASDLAWSFTRMLDPATKSTLGGLFGSIQEATAPDDNTLRLTLKSPSFPLLLNLTMHYAQPLLKAAVDKGGDQYGRAPLGVGPYKFKEWKTGDSIVLERNAEFKWGLPWFNGGPYIQTIEYRILPEVSTRVAALEAGEVDIEAFVAKDLDTVKAIPGIQILEYLLAGGKPSLLFNAGKPPFDDVRVRKAFNLAVDRANAIKVVELGNAKEMHLPTSPTMAGWWADGEKLGYGFDLAQAKQLMKDAGYTAGSDGTLVKDGQPLKLTLHTGTDPRLAEVLTEQLKALGASVSIVSLEWSKVLADVFAAKYDFCVFSYLGPDFDLVNVVFSSKAAGGLDLAYLKDPQLDKLLAATRTTTDPDKRQLACEEAQRYMIDKAVMGPLYAPKIFWAAGGRVKGLILSPVTTQIWVEGAYIAAK